MIGIDKLSKYFTDYSIEVERVTAYNGVGLLIRLTINQNVWEIMIDDEYNNFNSKNELLTLFLVFYSLEIYKGSNDFLAWCKALNLDASNNTLLTYYQSLNKTVVEIESIIGEVDSYISSYDYSLQSGEFMKLMKTII